MNHDLSERSSTPGSRRSLSHLKGRLFTLLAWGSALLGCSIGAAAVRPETLNTLSTLELLGILTLVSAPPLTLLALRHDRLVARDEGQPDRTTRPAHRSASHPAHQRSTSVHARIVDSHRQTRDIEQSA